MPFADELIGRPTALALIEAMQAAAPEKEFSALRAAPDRLGPLALRERSDLLRDALLADLPGTYSDLAATVRRAAAGVAPFAGWLIWPVTSAVAERAVEASTPSTASTVSKADNANPNDNPNPNPNPNPDPDDNPFDDAMALLAELTPRLTSEFAIRTLLRHDLSRALATIAGDWVTSPDVDVRRLASEGTRPYLPWASRVPRILQDPEATLPILTALYRDDSEYVRRSVANHLNDVSRGHPELVVATAATWLAAPDENTERLVGRSLRTLVKRGDPGALALVGFHPATLDVTDLSLDRSAVAIGESIAFAATVTNIGTEPARLSIDYAVHHRKANGTSTGKTFKLAVRTLAPGERVELMRQHSFRVITTRRYHPGTHGFELLINGVSAGRVDFELTPSEQSGALEV